ncbi:endoribonuclease MazF [Patescibacteria group bacterium]|nr:endoribonuclease MazF [Patescibacteria group bacterium]
MSKYIPTRGDLIWLNFSPQKGREQSGRRPAFVLSPKIYNQKVGLVIVCPVTTKAKNYPFEVTLTTRKISGVILTDQIKSLDWRKRRIKFIQKTSPKVTKEVQSKLHVLIG